MAGLFKKAMGLFVEFEEEKTTHATPIPRSGSQQARLAPDYPSPPGNVLNPEAVDKFGKHFEKLFDQANMPGPDYYEFWKMMETLEAHIKDERARISATYASLVIQGLTKEKLIATAEQYKKLIGDDQSSFEKAAKEKEAEAIGGKRQQMKQLEDTVEQHAALIKKLTQEIADSQKTMDALKGEITDAEQKLAHNRHGYVLACQAMMKKITDDITKIQTTL